MLNTSAFMADRFSTPNSGLRASWKKAHSTMTSTMGTMAFQNAGSWISPPPNSSREAATFSSPRGS